MGRFSERHLVWRGCVAVVAFAGGLGCGARNSLTVADGAETVPYECEECTTHPSANETCADGTSCDDGDPCTTGDICTAGVCTGTPVGCGAPPPAACISATTLRTSSGPGTCAVGMCSYTTTDSDCPLGCQGGACASPTTAVAISAGGSHTCVLTAAGAVKCWGRNNRGQLGNGSTVDSSVPVEGGGLSSGVIAISAGGGSSCALTALGAVKCWGDNTHGALGDGSTLQYSAVPVDVAGLSSGVAAISVGAAHTCALTTAGAVKCWGYNYYGELGNGTKIKSGVPVNVLGLPLSVIAIYAGAGNTCAIIDAGAIKCWGGSFYSPLPVNMTAVFAGGLVALSMGSGFMCAVTTNGAAQCFGSNYEGELGDGSKKEYGLSNGVAGLSSGVIAVSAGTRHACALTASGALKCWGDNGFGQLGDGSTGYGSKVPVDVVSLASNVVAVSAGGAHTCAVTAPGGVKCWGMDAHGELGDGTTTIMGPSPVGVVGF